MSTQLAHEPDLASLAPIQNPLAHFSQLSIGVAHCAVAKRVMRQPLSCIIQDEAKEVVVGTLGTLYGVEGSGLIGVIQNQFTPLSAYAFMVMSLIYIPCIAVIATIKRETNWRWTLLAVGYSLVLGWILAVAIYQIGIWF